MLACVLTPHLVPGARMTAEKLMLYLVVTCTSVTVAICLPSYPLVFHCSLDPYSHRRVRLLLPVTVIACSPCLDFFRAMESALPAPVKSLRRVLMKRQCVLEQETKSVLCLPPRDAHFRRSLSYWGLSRLACAVASAMFRYHMPKNNPRYAVAVVRSLVIW